MNPDALSDLVLLLVCAALLSGCAYRNAPFTPYAPALYEVVPADTAASGGGRAYLFGAIHTGLSRFYPLPEAVERTWAQATHLACELDAQARHAELRAAFARRTHLPDGTTLDTLVAPEVLQGIRTHLGYGPHEWRQRLRLRSGWRWNSDAFSCGSTSRAMNNMMTGTVSTLIQPARVWSSPATRSGTQPGSVPGAIQELMSVE